MNMLPHALAFARHSLSVVPLYSVTLRNGKLLCACGKRDCRSPAKHPITNRGLLDASTDPAIIKRWWASAEHNLGVRTDNLVVLDIDVRHDGHIALQKLETEHGELPATWRSITGGGGEHIIMRAPFSGLRNSASKLAPGIDVRAAHGYFAAPPSLHISGRRYTWSVDHHPRDLELAPAPQWLVDLLTVTPRIVAKGPINGSPATEWQALVGHDCPEGTRNDTIARLAGHLFRRDVNALVALDLMRAWNAYRCRPALGDDEVYQIINSIAECELRRRGVQ
jgi:hypothetical protein